MIYIINQNAENFLILLNRLYYIFSRDIHDGYLSLKDAHDEQSKFANKLKSIDKSITSIEKILFLINIGLFFSGKKFLITLKTDNFQ